ncbi:MAG TPA: aldo/keto reductase [Casimicrobiaceae bacterium]|jgi:diketogulonate reductase-like aldo/keto reductase
MNTRSSIPTVTLRDGARVPTLGLGTWRMGEHSRDRDAESASLHLGLDLGMTVIDTAEMYGDGGAEELVGEVIAGQRDRVFLVSKVYPHNAGAKSAIAACERSLKRLATDHLDLYLLHWRGRIPLAETLEAFERLRRDGKIVRWGVSNFDVDDIEELMAIPNGRQCAANQVLYHLGERAIEWQLATLCREHQIAIMAYSPVGQGDLLRSRKLHTIARETGATPAQLALAWLIKQGVIAIPKASTAAHVRDNRKAADITLSDRTVSALDAAFPPPKHAKPLAVI